jgi:hypothetical protein
MLEKKCGTIPAENAELSLQKRMAFKASGTPDFDNV